LVVIAPFGFGRIHVAPLLGAFAARHPGIVPTLMLTDAPRKAMGNDAWDVLIHVGRLPDLDLTYRRLATNRRLLVASATYARSRGLPADPRDLKQHTCGVVREDEADVSLWSLSQRGKAAQTIRVSPAFSSNDGEVVLQWVLSGMGIAERSEWSVSADLAAKRLVRVLPDWNLPDADIVAILNPRTVRTARAEALLQDLVAAFSGKEWN
jgi:DNA-binding transcriptional LysR family regulator